MSSYESNPFNLLRPSWEGVKLNLAAYIGLIAIALGLFFAGALGALFLFSSLHSSGPAFVLLVIGAVLAYLYFAIVYAGPAAYRLRLAMARHQTLKLSDALTNDPRLGWKLFWVNLLVGLAVLGGFILLIVPGIIFAVWFSYAAYLVIDENLTGPAALRRSRQLVKNRFWDAVGAVSLTQAVGIADAIPFIGPIIALVLGIMIIPLPVIRYDQLRELKKTSDGLDIPTHRLNYLAVVLAFVAMGAGSGSNQATYQEFTQKLVPVEKSVQSY